METLTEQKSKTFYIKILGRTLEHLGVQMYKQRNTAVTELVANCWDAGADNVYITLPNPESYDPESSKIVIEDDGCGMDDTAIEKDYLVIGKNRRQTSGDTVNDRPVMGRKGIGKLAGFGIANKMTIETWVNETCNTFSLDMDELKAGEGDTSDVPIISIQSEPPLDIHGKNGTRLTMEQLKHVSVPDVEKLHQALSRRFSRRVKGEMNIFIEDEKLHEPEIELEYSFPDDGSDYLEEQLEDGNTIKYSYSYSRKPIRETEMRGFTIHVRGKTAQAPNFFFDMEGVARGQHGTKYLTGAIIADFLDEGIDDESDIISTDRQEIDWENEKVEALKKWGKKFVQRLLDEWMELRGNNFEEFILSDVDLNARIQRLDKTSQKQVSRFLKILGQAETDPERAKDLGDALVRAYEYRNFHDIVSQLESVADNPDNLGRLLLCLYDWKALESRAILEIIKGRIEIIDKFFKMILGDAPETAHKTGDDNLHDLIAQYPWLLNPDWQVLVEERSISKTLREWHAEEEIKEGDGIRYDFLGLTDEGRLIIIEIKRSKHAVTYDELKKLETYKERLSRARSNIYMVMLCSGNLDVSEDTEKVWKQRTDGEIMSWNKVYKRTRQYYEHYKAVLEGNVEHMDFLKKEKEVQKTREILKTGTSFRGVEARQEGLGPQDVDYTNKTESN